MPEVVTVEGMDVTQADLNGAGWITALSNRKKQETKRPPLRDGQRGTVNKTAGYRTAKGPAKSLLSQVTAASRLPKLPKEQIKVIVRPKGGLDVSKADVVLLAQALAMAAALPEHQTKEDTVCPNKVQNILIIATPHASNARAYARLNKIHTKYGAYEVSAYVAAPEDTCKGVIRHIDPCHDEATLRNMIVNERNPTALEARRIKDSHVVVILFRGMRVPNHVICGTALLPCSLYRRQVDVFHACGHVGHRADVCISSEEERGKCRGCGKAKSDNEEEHQCTPKCEACGGPHVTGDRTCKKRYQIPYIVRCRRRRRRQRARKAQLDEESDVTEVIGDISSVAPAARSSSILGTRSLSGGRSRSRRREPKPRQGSSRSRSRSRSQSVKRATWADKVKGATQPSGKKNASSKGTTGKLFAPTTKTYL
ncbi:uncharacterized protein [Dermacentor albipictus]|uniref:uncharacterized protein n=1 Tax=Dermacentor albipictus TaxID=60249 RepID=UPI0038FCE02C